MVAVSEVENCIPGSSWTNTEMTKHMSGPKPEAKQGYREEAKLLCKYPLWYLDIVPVTCS